MKVEFVSDESYIGKEACAKHACIHEGCGTVIIKSYDYCLQHKCGWHRCPAPVLGSSKACSKHLCKATDCVKLRVHPHRHCKMHQCGYPNCRNASTEGARACEEHVCGYHTCLQPAQRHTSFCKVHTCKYPGCYDSSGPGGACLPHQCSASGCSKPKGFTSKGPTDGCAAHTCRIRLCSGLCEGGSFCKDHACNYPSCSRSSPSSRGACSSHRCKAPTCEETRVFSASGPQDGCAAHTCQTYGCSSQVCVGCRFCLEHCCHICWGEAASTSKYCETHSCSYPSCDQGCSLGEACSGHTCEIDSCNRCRQEGSVFCADHTYSPTEQGGGLSRDEPNQCSWTEDYVRCPQYPVEGGVFCPQHTCREQGCLQRIESADFQYCYWHEKRAHTRKELKNESQRLDNEGRRYEIEREQMDAFAGMQIVESSASARRQDFGNDRDVSNYQRGVVHGWYAARYCPSWQPGAVLPPVGPRPWLHPAGGHGLVTDRVWEECDIGETSPQGVSSS